MNLNTVCQLLFLLVISTLKHDVSNILRYITAGCYYFSSKNFHFDVFFNSHYPDMHLHVTLNKSTDFFSLKLNVII